MLPAMDWLDRVTGLALVFAIAGCPADDTSGSGTDTDEDESSSSGMPTTMPPPPTTTPTTTPTTASTSTTSDETTSTTGPITTGDPTGDTETTGGPTGICVGFDIVGNIDEVLSPQGSPLTDPPCDVTPAGCGGDVVGTWNIETTCGWDDLPNFFDDMCDGATMVVNSGSTTGTRTFEDDNTYTADLTSMLDFDVNIDTMTCFGIDCAGFETLLNMEPTLTSTCTDDGGGACDCAITSMSSGTADGTWATMDNDLTITVDGESAVLEYCSTGARLDLWQPIADTTFYTEPCEEDIDCFEALGDMSDAYVCFTE